MFAVPLLKRAIENLPQNSPESVLIKNMIIELATKEKVKPDLKGIRVRVSAKSARIDPEEYKDASQWVIPPLNDAIKELPASAPEIVDLERTIAELQRKEAFARLRTCPPEEAAVLV